MGALAVGFGLGTLAWEMMVRRRGVRLRGATAVVCGASRGLGRAIALELARRGVTAIALCARTERDLDGVATELQNMGVEVLAEPCDLSDEVATERFIAHVAERLGPIDVLVANASTITVGPIATLTRDDFDEAMESIFFTALNPILAAVPRMRTQRKGTIALITSIGGRVGVPHLAPYCAAKFAAVGLSESLRAELAADNVNVLTVVPGLMRTGSNVHADFKGNHDLEYAWFGASANAPILSINAERAARRIVSAIARGDVELTFTPEARIAPVLQTLFPTLWSELLALSARLLPRPPIASTFATEKKEGDEIADESDSPLVHAVQRRSEKFAVQNAQR
jgi:NAD(P)-dependent dehydrogenase (short-subunit alcohol dehydrogenase family)